MASGNINLTSNVGGITGLISWQSTAYTTDNYSLVNVQVYVICNNYGIQGTGSGTWSENGSGTPFSPYVNIGYGGSGTTQVFSKNGIRVNHDSNGNGSITLGCSMNFSFAGVSNLSGSQTIQMDKIDRYPEFTELKVDNTTLETATISWKANSECDGIDYNIDGGNSIVGASPKFTITGLRPNTTYKIQVNIRRKSSQLWRSKEISVTTKNISTISNITSSNVDSAQRIEFNNPSGNTVNLYIRNSSGILIGSRTNIVSPISVNFSSNEKDSIYKYYTTTNSAVLTYELETVEKNAYTSSAKGTVAITNANPIFSDFKYFDNRELTERLTGNNKKFIRNYSDLLITIPVSSQAVAQKGAYMVKYRVECGDKKQEVSFDNYKDIELNLSEIPSSVVLVKAIDSRGNITTIQVDLDIIEYEKPTIENFKVTRKDGIGTTVNIIANGTFDNINFGEITNEIKNIFYRRKTKNEEWTDLTDISNLFDYDYEKETFKNKDVAEVANFELGKEYEIELIAFDELDYYSSSFVLTSGESIVCFNKTKKITGFGKIPDRKLPEGSIDAKGTINANNITINGVPVGVEQRELIYEGQLSINTKGITLPEINNCKKIYITVETPGNKFEFEMDIENPVDVLNNACFGSGFFIEPKYVANSPRIWCATAIFYKNINNFMFDDYFSFSFSNGSFNDRAGYAGYYITKIEGVK